jgi:hypothetical protein
MIDQLQRKICALHLHVKRRQIKIKNPLKTLGRELVSLPELIWSSLEAWEYPTGAIGRHEPSSSFRAVQNNEGHLGNTLSLLIWSLFLLFAVLFLTCFAASLAESGEPTENWASLRRHVDVSAWLHAEDEHEQMVVNRTSEHVCQAWEKGTDFTKAIRRGQNGYSVLLDIFTLPVRSRWWGKQTIAYTP